MLGADTALHEVSFFSAFFPNGLSNHALENFSCTWLAVSSFVSKRGAALNASNFGPFRQSRFLGLQTAKVSNYYFLRVL